MHKLQIELKENHKPVLSLLKKLQRRVLKYLDIVSRGQGLKSKVILLLLLPLLFFFSFRIGRRYSALVQTIRAILRKATITYRGCTFRLVDEESVFILSEGFEPWAWNYLALPKGAVFVDVGAHVGRYAIVIAKMIEKMTCNSNRAGLVIAIEPTPENYRTLVENIKLNGLKNIVALNVAAWNSNCELDLYLAECGGWHSVKNRSSQSVRVKAMTVDTILEKLNVMRVDAVKVDVEGAEVEVLEGMKKAVERFSPKILVEVRRENLEKFSKIIEAWGYRAELIPGSEPVYFICEPNTNQL